MLSLQRFTLIPRGATCPFFPSSPCFVLGFCCSVSVLRSCGPATEPENPPPKPRKYERKKKLNPPPRVGPRKYRKNTEKIRKRPENSNFWAVLYFFGIFSVFPKGPFRTKNAIAMEIVVFCYRGSLLLSVLIRCHFSQEKQHPNYYRGSELLSR